jgi:hypothetical protein
VLGNIAKDESGVPGKRMRRVERMAAKAGDEIRPEDVSASENAYSSYNKDDAIVQ